MNENPETDDRIEEVDRHIVSGEPLVALDQLVTCIDGLASNPQFYRKAFEALSLAVSSRMEDLKGLTHRYSHLYMQLLLQSNYNEPELIFHHGVASLITSENAHTAKAITALLSPIIDLLLADGPPSQPLLIFLLITRSFRIKNLSQSKISEWHIREFPQFSSSRLALQYSVMFHKEAFGRNQADLLSKYCSCEAILKSEPALSLRHILLLEWLGAPSPFTKPDNEDLLETLQRCLTSKNVEKNELRAARSLILRHKRRDSKITLSRAIELGIGEDVMVFHDKSCKRPIQDYGSLEYGRIPRRTYQALQVMRQRVARRAPFLGNPDKGLRVAICVSGQLRGYKSALASWRRTLFADVSHDIFVHTWKQVGRAGAQPSRSVLPFDGKAFSAAWRRYGTLEGYNAMRARYPSLFWALKDGSEASEQEVRDIYNAKKVVIEDEKEPRFVRFSNQDKMHYKIWAAHQLAVECDENYDLILRIRPDYGVRYIAFSWRDLATVCRKKSVVWADRALSVHYGRPMIGDQIAVGYPNAMEQYAETWESYPSLARLDLAAASEKFAGHVSLAQATWLSGLVVQRLPVGGIGLLEAERLSSAKIVEALKFDASGRNDEVDRRLIEAACWDLH